MKHLQTFCIKGSPSTRTAQQKGVRIVNGHAHFYEKKEVAAEKDALMAALMNYAPDEPYQGPLYLRLLWVFDKKSLSKSENNSFNVVRPDVDNLAKGCIDCLCDCGFFDDDNVISKLELSKVWSRDYPGLFVQIWELTDDWDFDDLIADWGEPR